MGIAIAGNTMSASNLRGARGGGVQKTISETVSCINAGISQRASCRDTSAGSIAIAENTMSACSVPETQLQDDSDLDGAVWHGADSMQVDEHGSAFAATQVVPQDMPAETVSLQSD